MEPPGRNQGESGRGGRMKSVWRQTSFQNKKRGKDPETVDKKAVSIREEMKICG